MTCEFAIIGAGMAGASVAAELAPHGSTVILEAEEQPGYHSTGRSAAFWTETYGGPEVQPLTTASYEALANPDPGFSETGFLKRRGALHLADSDSTALLDAFAADFAASAVRLEPLDAEGCRAMVPGLRDKWRRGLWEASCADIDVAALHQAYLRQARRHGAELRCSAPFEHAEPIDEGWRITAGGDRIDARILVNAAGAWADMVAERAGIAPIGITPYRRTMIQLRTDPAPPADLPLVIDARGRFYFKAEGGDRLWLSPHDEGQAEPGDVAPEEIDIARAIDRFESAVDWRIEAVERRWAGLRSFAPDRKPVYGFDPQSPGFFWCAGQGGFGIQTAPAAARLAAAIVLGRQNDPLFDALDPAAYRPDRFGR